MTPENSPTDTGDFRMLGIAPTLLQVLDGKGITSPTPIQHQTIPSALQGKDIVGIAQTGTGKTLSFGLPLLQRLASEKGRALILVPTRELAFQVDDSLRPFANAVGIRTAVFVGGSPMHLQRKSLQRNPRILIATPGRLNDHIQQRTVTLKEVTILVLDEADRMLDMGFKPQIDTILKNTPKERQTLLFSATMAPEIFALATKEMHLPLRIEVAPAGTTAAKVEQELIVVQQENKSTLLLSLLKETTGSVLVFSRTKHGAKKITRDINNANIRAAEIHANRSLAQRRDALAGFKTGKFRVLVATDIAARGIDVTDIAVVINYDLPDDPADYVHRIGRTGRAGKSGKAISFARPSQAKDVQKIEKLIKASLPRRKVHSMPEATLDPRLEETKGRRGGGNRRGSRPPRSRDNSHPPRNKNRSGGKRRRRR